MKEPVPFLPRLRCPQCRNTNPPSLSIATAVYWMYPDWRQRGSVIEVALTSGEVNMSGGPGITYFLMCHLITCGAITPLPATYRVTLV